MKKSLSIVKPLLSTLWKGLLIAGCVFGALQLDRWYRSDESSAAPDTTSQPVTPNEQPKGIPTSPTDEAKIPVPEKVEHLSAPTGQETAQAEVASRDEKPETPSSSPVYLTTKELTKKTRPSLCYITTHGRTSGTGSGFFMKRPDLVITNFHVINEADDIQIQDLDGNTFQVLGILGWSKETDLAILQVQRDNGEFLSLSKDLVDVGDELFIMGNPKGLQGSISLGVISGLRELKERSWLQLSADISPGSSGSPVLNKQGDVIGVATFTLSDKFSQNLNFASHKVELKKLMTEKVGPSPSIDKDKLTSIADFQQEISKKAELASNHSPTQEQDEIEVDTPSDFPLDQLSTMRNCWSLAKKKQLSSLESEIKTLLKHPESTATYAFIEGCREFSTGKKMLAYKSFKVALREQPQSAYLWEVTGENATHSDKLSTAAAFFIVSLQLDPQRPEAWAKAGYIMRRLERYKSAGIYAQKVAVGHTPSMRDLFVKSGMWLPEISGAEEQQKWRELYASYFWTEVMPTSPSYWHEHVLDVRRWEGVEKARERLKVGYHKTNESPDLQDLMKTLQ